jgi:CRP-like cAMP-binding protein
VAGQTNDRQLIHAVVSKLMPSDTSRAQIAALGRHCWTLSAERGHVVASRGERLPGVLVLASGFAKLVLQGSRREGKVLRVVTAGEMFGAESALLGRPAPYDAVSMGDCKLVVIPAQAIFSLMDLEPRFARSVVKMLSEGNFELLAEIEAATLRRGAQRLASYLGSLVPVDAPAGPCTVRLPVSKTVVAARLGLKKETLSRLFRQLAAEGLIEVSRSEITILDRERLGEIAR